MRCIQALGVAVMLAIGSAVFAQVPANLVTGNGAVGGVAISTDGFLQMRQTAPSAHVASRPAETQAHGPGRLLYISLPRVLLEWKNAKDAGRSPAADVLDLHGLECIQDVFIFPAERDIVLAGPSEPVKTDNPLEPEGALTGRPVVQLEDVITALRAVHAGGKKATFGCSLDLAPGAQQIAQRVSAQMTGASAEQQAAALQQALGPQQVRILGVPGDSRVALAMVSADYRLKRIAMGAEKIAGVGDAVSSGVVANRVWFEPAYDPLQVSPDGLSYGISGPRLKVLAGAQQFDPSGATPAASAFAKRISAKMTDVAGRVEAIADLQNVTDLFLLANLLEHGKLAEKAGLDLGWLLAAGADGASAYRVQSLTEPRTAQTIVSDNGNMITEGGVLIDGELLAIAHADHAATDLPALRERPASGWFLSRPPAKH